MLLSDSGSGSASTVSKEDASYVLSSEEDSSTLVCELGLSLSLGVGGGGYFKMKAQRSGGPKILTAEDFNSVVSPSSPPSSASSSSSPSSTHNTRANNGIAGTKRAADSVSASNAASQVVVGWPPIRAYRMNNFGNPGKPPLNKAFVSTNEKSNGTDAAALEKGNEESNPKQRVCLKKSLFVKVNMDGIAIGRKVDVSAHNCYQPLAQTLETMFSAAPSGNVNNASIRATRASKLLDGSSGYILTYEDKDGDWMLVGDVPWRMFLDTVKRLRIMRSAEATGNAIPTFCGT